MILTKYSIAAIALATSIVAESADTDFREATAKAKTCSPTSNVEGKAFDRIAIIWLENTDYDKAAGDPNLAALAKKGITLSNYFAVTHPSEPNYVACIGGDYFGMNNDAVNNIPANISSVVDLLEDKGISWGHYEEDMPYTGFQGAQYLNPKTGANDYVRKHNPAIIYESVTTNPERLANIKNLTMFYSDLAADKLPQWMFITPNMTSDGHDSSVTVAGSWTNGFLTPLLSNKHFMKNTLVLVTFDENHSYTSQNRVFSILLGDSIDEDLVGTTDSNFYDHYSEISTVAANWDLHTLGRWDTGANVFSVVADKTHDTIRKWTSPDLSTVFFNSSYPGLFNSKNANVPLPAPNTSATYNKRTVLPQIVSTWANDQQDSYYTSNVEIPDGQHPPTYHK